MRGASILVVDDEASAVEIMKRILERQGHLVMGASSAEEALTTLETSRFDLILLDHVLPGMTGLQALRKLSSLARAPVYLMSGYSDEGFRADAFLIGAAGFIAKPIDFAALEAVVDSLPERPS